MGKLFDPKIDRGLFRNSVLEHQSKEGNSGPVVQAIKSRLASYSNLYFFDAFVAVCGDLNVVYECSEVTQGAQRQFIINVFQSGHVAATLSMGSKDRDVSEELAGALYAALWSAVRNRLFIDSVKYR